MSGGNGHAPEVGSPRRSGGDDGHDPAHLPGRRRRPAGARARDRRSLAVRVAALGVLVPALAGAAAVDARRPAPQEPPPARPAPVTPTAPGGGRPTTWYCAAGTASAGGMADHTVEIADHGAGVRAALTVVPGDGVPGDGVSGEGAGDGTPGGESPGGGSRGGAPSPRVRQVEVPAGGVVAVRLGDVVDAPLAAAVVEVGAGDATVWHRVRGEHGEDVGPCATATADVWHLAWGATTRDARAVVVLFNPFPSPATVDALVTTEEGRRQPVRLQGVPVPGRSAVGLDLGRDVTRSEHVSATFRARSGRIVVERLQQYDGSLGRRGLALDLGAPAPALAWAFADGEASAPAPLTPPPGAGGGAGGAGGERRWTERIVVYNPGDERAEVDVLATPAPAGEGAPARPPLPFHLSVGPGARKLVDYGEHDRIPPGVPHATVVRATNGRPVVVERVTLALDQGEGVAGPVPGAGPLPGPGTGALAGGTGAVLAADRWALPPAGAPGTGRSVAATVLNPGAVAVEVRVARPAGAPYRPRSVEVGPGERVEVGLGAGSVTGGGGIVLAADGPVVVEGVVRDAAGRRLATDPAIPLGEGAVPLA